MSKMGYCYTCQKGYRNYCKRCRRKWNENFDAMMISWMTRDSEAKPEAHVGSAVKKLQLVGWEIEVTLRWHRKPQLLELSAQPVRQHKALVDCRQNKSEPRKRREPKS